MLLERILLMLYTLKLTKFMLIYNLEKKVLKIELFQLYLHMKVIKKILLRKKN